MKKVSFSVDEMIDRGSRNQTSTFRRLDNSIKIEIININANIVLHVLLIYLLLNLKNRQNDLFHYSTGKILTRNKNFHSIVIFYSHRNLREVLFYFLILQCREEVLYSLTRFHY